MSSNKRNAEKRGTILVADDDAAILDLVRTLLTAVGHRVLLARDGDDAIRLVGQKHLSIDAALLDIHMPGMRSAELANEIRALRPKLPILFMSGIVDDEIIRIRLLDGYAGFLAKPFRHDCLLRAVWQAMAASASGGGGADGERAFTAAEDGAFDGIAT